MKNRICSLAAAALLGLLCVMPVSAAEDGVPTGMNRVLDDQADILSSEEEKEVQKALNDIYGTQAVTIYIEQSSDQSAQQRADTLQDADTFTDGILFYLNMDAGNWAISTEGDAIRAFTDAGLDFIMDDVQPTLRDGDYAAAFCDFAAYCDDFMDQAANGQPYDTGNMPKQPLSLLWIPGSIAIGCVISLIVMLVLKSQMQSVEMQHGAADYVKQGSMKMRSSRDIFLYRKVEKTEKEQQNGGSATHQSDSGATHGGASGSF